MPSINADQRQAIKQQQAQTAVLDNNIAAVLGIAAVVAPAPMKPALGIGAGLFWLCANYRQMVANDPPRDDYDVEWSTSAALDESALPGDTDDAKTLYQLDGQSMLLSDANYALLLSLERYDGAVAAGDDEAAAEQLNAASYNAQALADNQDALAGTASQLNAIYASITAQVDLSSVTLDDARQYYSENVSPTAEGPVPGIDAVTGAASDLLQLQPDTGLAHPILQADALPAPPQQLISDDYVELLSASSETLRNLIVEGDS